MKLRLARKVLYRWHRRRRGPLPLERRQSTGAAAVERWAAHFRRWRRAHPGPFQVAPSGRPGVVSPTREITKASWARAALTTYKPDGDLEPGDR